MREVAIAGVGLHKCGRFGDKPLLDIGREATVAALKDANLEWKDIQAAYCSVVLTRGSIGVKVLTQLGRTTIPICDVEGACASGGVALRNAYMAVASGMYDIVLCLGVEKAPRGFLPPDDGYERWQIETGLSQNPMYWAMRARRHMADYGTTKEQLAKVSVKNHANGALNPYAMYQRAMTMEEILASPVVCDPIHLYMLCAPDEGAAAVVVCSIDVARRLTAKPITIAASAHRTSPYSWFFVPMYSFTARSIDNPAPTPITAKEAYAQAGLGPEDLDVAEVQDADSFCEIEAYEELGFCAYGEGGRLVDEGVTEIGGRLPVNTSGGLLSCGEPLGASHLRQVCEIVWQLRDEAGPRQVSNAKVGLAHVLGALGHCAVTILKR